MQWRAGRNNPWNYENIKPQVLFSKSRNGKHSARLTGMYWGLMDVPGKRWKTRPRTPWHVGPLKVGLLSVNSPQNPPDQQAHQTQRSTRPTGPTTHRPMVSNCEKLWITVRNGEKQQETVRNSKKRWKTVRNSKKLWEIVRNGEKQWKTVINGEKQ